MGVPAVIKVPAEGSLGPKMRALTDKQRAFVCAIAELGTGNYTQCARAAGYADNGGSMIHVTAHELAHDERIQEAMFEEAQRRLNVNGLIAVTTLQAIATNPAHKDQMKAAVAFLDRSGLHAKTEHTVKVKDESRTEEALIERATQLAAQLGYGPDELQRMITSAGVIDVDFSVVPEKEEWE